MIDFSDVLTRSEITAFTLRKIYREQGYSQYKMSKFEEYDLYVKNKDFLVSDSVLTFTDTDGKLLALKPDVTLSIIKNGKDNPTELMKVYYDENVYRVSKGTKTFREIKQVGVECVGAVTDSTIAEVLGLAVRSLASISTSSVLEISNLDLIPGLFDYYGVSESARGEVIALLSQKNGDGVAQALASDGMSESAVNAFTDLISIYGAPEKVLPRLACYEVNEQTKRAVSELFSAVQGLTSGGATKISIDFSLTGDMKYYNGIAFKGFVEGVPSSVLSGGSYDKLMKRMGKRSRAIGFAVYLDELERLFFRREEQ